MKMVKLEAAEKRQAEQEKHSKDQSPQKQEKNKAAKEKKAAEAKTEHVLARTATLHDMEVILYPLVTEKAVNMIESENKITFVVSDNSGKNEVKKVVEEAYGVKVKKINIVRDMRGRKKAIVKLDKKFKASELATKLGVL